MGMTYIWWYRWFSHQKQVRWEVFCWSGMQALASFLFVKLGWRVTSYNYISRCTVFHESVILLQPEFLMKCVSRVWFCNQFPFCMGRSRYTAAFLFPKFEPEPHIYTYIPTSSPQKQSQNPQEVRNHHILGRSLFLILQKCHGRPDDGLTIIFDSRVGLTLTVTESTPPT